MKIVTINSWTSLPWQKINNRVFALQEKIYKFAAQCDQKNVYKLQDYILNSSDVKLFAIQSICNNIKDYYFNQDKEKYDLKNCDKIYIYNYLFSCKKHSEKIQIIIENIKQYLVYLCLKPEWEARFEPLYKFNINKRQKCYLIYKLSNFFSKSKNYNQKHLNSYIYSLNNQKINKYLDVSNLIYRLQTLPAISYYISCWLKNQNVVESLSMIKNKYIESKITISYLDQLLFYIAYNGLEWYSMMTLHTKFKSRTVFRNFYLVFSTDKVLEIYTNRITCSRIFLQVMQSICDIIKFYHRDSKYISEYQKQSLRKKINISDDFLIVHNFKKIYDYGLSIVINPCSYKDFRRYIKKYLYHLDLSNRLRPNALSNLSKILVILRKLILDFYLCYYPLFNRDNINYVFKSFDYMMIKWLKKKNQNISSVSINNKYLSQQILCIS